MPKGGYPLRMAEGYNLACKFKGEIAKK